MKKLNIYIFLILFFLQLFAVTLMLVYPFNYPAVQSANNLLFISNKIHQFFFIFLFVLLIISCFRETTMKYILISLSVSLVLLYIDIPIQEYFMQIYGYIEGSYVYPLLFICLIALFFYLYLNKKRRDKILLSAVIIVGLLISFYSLFAFDKLYKTYVNIYISEIKTMDNLNALEIYDVCKTGLYYCYVGKPSLSDLDNELFVSMLAANDSGIYYEPFIKKSLLREKVMVVFNKNGNTLYVAEYIRLLELKNSLYLFYSFILAISSLFWSNLMIMANIFHNFRQKLR